MGQGDEAFVDENFHSLGIEQDLCLFDGFQAVDALKILAEYFLTVKSRDSNGGATYLHIGAGGCQQMPGLFHGIVVNISVFQGKFPGNGQSAGGFCPLRQGLAPVVEPANEDPAAGGVFKTLGCVEIRAVFAVGFLFRREAVAVEMADEEYGGCHGGFHG